MPLVLYLQECNLTGYAARLIIFCISKSEREESR